MPSERTLLSAIDVQARRTVDNAKQALAPIVAREVPRGRTSKVAAALRPKVSRTQTGAAVTISAPRGRVHSGQATIAEVVRWITRGTGIYRQGGGARRRIRAKRLGRRMILPGGRAVWSVKGQRPNPFLDRIEAVGTLRVQRIFEQGARDAARAVERSLSR